MRLISDRLLADYNPESLAPSDGIAFGGGGVYVPLQMAWRMRTGRQRWTVRVGSDLHIASLVGMLGPEVVGALGNFVGDGLSYAFNSDSTMRWQWSPTVDAVVALHGQWWSPADASARSFGLIRVLLGVGPTARRGLLLPFVVGEAGGGAGLLINRHEYRVGLGVRYAVD